MIRSVVVSGIAGWIMLGVVVCSINDPLAIVEAAEGAFMQALGQATGETVALILGWAIAIAQYLCGLATVTAASRMAYAFARDGGLPCSQWLAKVSHDTRVPVVGIWTVSVVSVLFTLWTPVYATITSVCTILLYLSYVVPLFLAARALGRTWTDLGPFQLGIWFKPAAIVSVVGCAGLVVLGVQPPNEQALMALAVLGVTLVAYWRLIAARDFKGPPSLSISDRTRIQKIHEVEASLDEDPASP